MSKTKLQRKYVVSNNPSINASKSSPTKWSRTFPSTTTFESEKMTSVAASNKFGNHHQQENWPTFQILLRYQGIIKEVLNRNSIIEHLLMNFLIQWMRSDSFRTKWKKLLYSQAIIPLKSAISPLLAPLTSNTRRKTVSLEAQITASFKRVLSILESQNKAQHSWFNRIHKWNKWTYQRRHIAPGLTSKSNSSKTLARNYRGSTKGNLRR